MNDFLMQFQSDILGVDVDRPVIQETTALGAADLVGLAVGYWKDKEEIRKQWNINRIFQPNITSKNREELYMGWKQAVKATRVYK